MGKYKTEEKKLNLGLIKQICQGPGGMTLTVSTTDQSRGQLKSSGLAVGIFSIRLLMCLRFSSVLTPLPPAATLMSTPFSSSSQSKGTSFLFRGASSTSSSSKRLKTLSTTSFFRLATLGCPGLPAEPCHRIKTNVS